MKKQVLSILGAGVIALTVGGQAKATSITNGLVASFAFDGNSNNSVGSNNGTAYNGVQYVDGILGQAASLDGINDYIAVSASSNLSFYTHDYTVSFWFNTNHGGYMLDERWGSERGYTLTSYGANSGHPGTGGLYFSAQDGIANGNYVTTEGFQDSNWHLATGVRNGNNLLLYVDGVLSVNSSSNVIDVGASNTIWLGRRFERTAPDAYYDGLLDDLNIYNRALSSTEVQTLYNEAAPVPEPATILLMGTGVAGLIGARRKKK